MHYQSEKDILSKLRDGSSEAFEEMFFRYGGKLYNFVMKISSGNTYLSEEIVQNTFIKIWESHTAVDPNKSFISYLCTIAKNMLVNEYEHQTVQYIYRNYVLNHYSEAGSSNYTEREINRNLLEEYIEVLITKMPPGRRQVFIMSWKKMMSNKEISRELQISESTVQTQLSKAIAFMRKHLAGYYDHIPFLILMSFFVN